jgi:hypothetical protein
VVSLFPFLFHLCDAAKCQPGFYFNPHKIGDGTIGLQLQAFGFAKGIWQGKPSII